VPTARGGACALATLASAIAATQRIVIALLRAM